MNHTVKVYLQKTLDGTDKSIYDVNSPPFWILVRLLL